MTDDVPDANVGSHPTASGSRTTDVVEDLAGALRVDVDDLRLLERALVHRSYSFEQGAPSNERLEFLGDSVLDVVVTDELYHLRPDDPEGRLAELRAATVSEPSLAGIARDIGLGRHLRLGVGESDSGGADKDSLLADALEAVLGAIYLDQGFEVVYGVVQRLFASRLGDLLARPSVTDPKTALQEHTESARGELPRYETTGSGPDHQRTFTASVRVGGEVVGTGSGPTKKAAERAAAMTAMTQLTEEPIAHAVPAAPVALAGTRGRGGTDADFADGTGSRSVADIDIDDGTGSRSVADIDIDDGTGSRSVTDARPSTNGRAR